MIDVLQSIYFQLGVIILLTLVISSILIRLKQPAILAYILAGILVGPHAFGTLGDEQLFGVFSHIGVSLLLFMVGMHLNPKVIKEVGGVSLATGVLQFLVASGIGFALSIILGFSYIEALYIAVGITFSSTIIVLKILSDRKETESLYGKIAIGFLIVQDIIAVIALVFVHVFDASQSLSSVLITILFDFIGLGALLFFIAKYILPKITEEFARKNDHLFLFAMGWCFAVASLFGLAGLSIETGALLAGVCLSVSPYRQEISAKLRVLRDFFLFLFFVILGAQIEFGALKTDWLAILILSVFILIFTPILVMFVMSLLGYTKRTSFFTGIIVSQISEFSLILVGLGVAQGHISTAVLSDVTIIGLITIAGSTYFMKYKEQLFKLVDPYLFFFKNSTKEDFGSVMHSKAHKVVMFGAHRVGGDLLETFVKLKHKCLVVDYNPDVIKAMKRKKLDALYGDAQDAALLEGIDFAHVKLVVSTIASLDVNGTVIRATRAQNEKCIVLCVAHTIAEALKLYEIGATYVIMPHYLGGKHTSLMVEDFGFEQKHFLKERFLHIEHLKLHREGKKL